MTTNIQLQEYSDALIQHMSVQESRTYKPTFTVTEAV